jgi:hypothetical protein
MDRRYRKVVESASGMGKLYEKSDFIDDVLYEYSILQSFTEVQTPRGSKVVSGPLELHGSIELKGISHTLSGKTYRLQTAEGVLFDIVIYKGDYVKNRYDFTKTDE